jgi:citrate lyase subunit beta/citryl-CoA lyase
MSLRFRSLLFVPGNRADMLAKAPGYAANAVIPDLEDSVPIAEKTAARAIVAESIHALAASGKAVLPRVNSLQTGRTRDDINAVVTADTVAISIGKVSGAGDIMAVDDLLKEREREIGLPEGSTGILPWIETAIGVTHALEICEASLRVRWAAFGAEDFAADMGFSRAVDSTGAANFDPRYGEPGLLYARSAIAAATRATGVWSLDTPYVKFRDTEGLAADCMLARRLGFRGKFAIHPAQLETINAAFAPSEAEVAKARRVIEAAEAAERDGRGAVALDGEMVDAPVIARARNVLADAGTE